MSQAEDNVHLPANGTASFFEEFEKNIGESFSSLRFDSIPTSGNVMYYA